MTSLKKQVEATPIYMIDNQTKPQQHSSFSNSTPSSKKPISKGYSNLLFNSSRSLLYANCMNNYLYEYNLVTYNSSHTRSINQKLNQASKVTYHTNTSNFIKSSLSKCDNFLLTGSSDFNAYIYPTHVNNQYSRHFKRLLPAIVLKGHTNEVTAVQWNPFDSNQLVTCSDDNTIRLWNVRREIDDLTTKECNFTSAQLLSEFEQSEEPVMATQENPQTQVEAASSKTSEEMDVCQNVDEDYDDFYNFTSNIRKNKHMHTKYRPNFTGVFDDFLFVNYEYKNFMRKCPTKTLSQTDYVNELSLKCQNINLDKHDETKTGASSQDGSSSPGSPTSRLLNSIENDLTRSVF